MNRFAHGSTFFPFLLLALCSAMQGQIISVSPTPLTLNEQSWTVEVKVKNLTPHPVQVSSGVISHVVRSDANGHMYMDSAATWDEMARSCAAWLKISPRGLMLPPNSWRTLRVSIATPHSLSNGEFWGSLVLRGETTGQVLATADSAFRHAHVATASDLTIPIVVRKGEVESGLSLGTVTALLQNNHNSKTSRGTDTVWGENSTIVLVNAKRLGNGAYRGTIMASIRRDDGTEVASSRRRYSLLWDRTLRLEFPRIKDGSYVLALESHTEDEEGNPTTPILPSPVTKNVRLVVHGEDVRVME